MKKLNLIHKFERWKASHVELLGQIDTLRKENERLKQRVTQLQQAKEQAENQADDRKREKEALRAKLVAQKKAAEGNEVQVKQLGAKITELRAEIEKLKRTKKR